MRERLRKIRLEIEEKGYTSKYTSFIGSKWPTVCYNACEYGSKSSEMLAQASSPLIFSTGQFKGRRQLREGGCGGRFGMSYTKHSGIFYPYCMHSVPLKISKSFRPN